MAKQKSSVFSDEILDALLEGQDPATVLRSDGLLGELKKALAERMLSTEMAVHLESEAEQQSGNHRNGTSQKTVISEDGELVLSIPRDRHGRFNPALIGKYQRRFPGFDEKIIALYARGMSGRLRGLVLQPSTLAKMMFPGRLALRKSATASSLQRRCLQWRSRWRNSKKSTWDRHSSPSSSAARSSSAP